MIIFTIKIVLYHICNFQHSHLHSPIYYWCQHLSISFFQQINDSFDMYSFHINILFYFIRQKRLKNIMPSVTEQRRLGCLLVCGTEVFQSNAFNIHRPITTIVFRLNLVCKSGYYMFCIITAAQHIL